MLTGTIGPAVEQRRVYATWFEGLFVRALGTRLSPALITALRAAGLDVERKLEPSYPAEVRLECLRLARVHLFGALNDEQAWTALGRAAVDGFLQTLVGHTFALVFRLLGPRAVMKRSSAAMTAASNYVSAEAIERAPFRWEVRLEGADLPPAYYQGLGAAALEVCEVDALQVLVVTHVGEQVVLSCTWAPPVSKR